MSSFTYRAPQTVEETLSILQEQGVKARVAAGCTNILPDIESKKITECLLVDISGLDELKGIQVIDNKITIGALTTIDQLIHSEVIEENAFVLWQACRQFADPLVRNRATLCGNMAKPSPAADGVVPLLALEATVTVGSLTTGRRDLPIEEFLVGPGKSALKPDELILSVSFQGNNPLGSFTKFGLRKAMAISLINIAVVLEMKDGTISKARIALGSVAPTAVRARKTEAFLCGREITPEVLAQAAELVQTEINPIGDIRASREYRLLLAGVLLRRTIEAAIAPGSELAQREFSDDNDRAESLQPAQAVQEDLEDEGESIPSKVEIESVRPIDPGVSRLNEVAIRVKVNGIDIRASVLPEESLLEFLRDKVRSFDVKCGCKKGDCGTCTVVFAGKTVKSCLVLAAQAHKQEIWTLKGMENDQLMHDLQESFAKHGAVQCGFCTPGMLVTAKSFLEQEPYPSREQIKAALAGNLCRCTGYKKIVDAVSAVAGTSV
ncbi:FAD binding domain-containing protein [Desulfosporosinus sp.]|uniref:FAD binding domain-containing protein n=1 Tax=Desulfosporosinus sp. TaxID=157907 RepID=UPI0025C04299|nr:FAD binding domain-containing protein [Desulfosporosinus sp.]MBC2721561.1 FAD binding domain-containing protein [Desulfosporosinus sp.]MBC2727027.1 FAD binding domain-containing protein [Desulfosporosinus sp.]